MKLRPTTVLLAVLFAGLTLYAPTTRPVTATPASDLPGFTPIQKRLVSGFASFELDPQNVSDLQQPKNYSPRGSGDCAVNTASNIKVNQNCLNLSDPDLQGRSQAQNETFAAQDPNQPNHMVASFNDYRRGDSTCGVAWSVDKGRTWNDSTAPTGFTRGTAFGGKPREYWQAGGDTSVAWDTQGNAYLSCQVFKRGIGTSPDRDSSNGLYVYRSTGNFGASWNFPGRAVVERNNTAGNFLPLLDKQLMTVDNTVGSPFQDRVYVTWTEFKPDGTAYIYEAYSADYGEHFSAPILVSGDSPLCTQTYGLPTPQGRCNENQFSQPFTAPDGTLYVTWANFNNTVSGNENRNQMLLAKSTNGGVSFSAPVKVADYYDLPDCSTYQGQDAGRACVPEKGSGQNSFFRATNYPSGAVNPTNASQVVVTFGSYINAHSKESNGCAPAGLEPNFGTNLFTGVKTAGACNNDILISVSNNGGATFTGTTTDPRALASVNQDAGQATSDQWFQWAAFTKNGKLAVSYYDRQYGDDETTGFSDFSLSGSGDLTNFAVSRATSSSMPPPTQFSGTFWGDYTGLTAVDNAYPIWSDTRNPDLFVCRDNAGNVTTPPSICVASASNASIANDQDAYTAAVAVPSR